MNELKKSLNSIEDGISAAIIYIDESSGVMKIDGSDDLRTAVYEVSRYVISRSNELKKSPAEKPKPPNTTCFLPKLPPGGIDKLSYSTLDL